MKPLKVSITRFFCCLCLVFTACGRNASIVDLVDINEWDSATILVLKEELHLDSLLSNYWESDSPPKMSLDQSFIVNDYEEEINYFLSFREKIMKVLKEQSYISVDCIYINEYQGFTFSGFTQSFSVYVDKGDNYYYEYNVDTDSFLVTKLNDSIFNDAENITHYYVNTEEYTITGMQILSKINRNNNGITYDIKEVSIW